MMTDTTAALINRLRERHVSHHGDGYEPPFINPDGPAAADLIEALSLPAEGYVLMPVEPTEAMLDAGGKCQPFMLPDGQSFAPGQIIASSVYRAMIAACRPAAPVAPAEGYVLVPVEPTEAMVSAGMSEIDWCRDDQVQDKFRPFLKLNQDGSSYSGTSPGEDVRDAYRAMIAASSSKPIAPGDTG